MDGYKDFTDRRVIPKIVLYLSVLLALPAIAQVQQLGPLKGKALRAWQSDVREWQTTRVNKLTTADGWLTLAGFEWLPDGSSAVGSAADMDIVLPGGPDYWGTIAVRDGKVGFLPADDSGVFVGGRQPPLAALTADHQGEPTIVSADNLSFYVIYREKLAIRVKDSQSPVRSHFQGLDYFPVTVDWRKVARYVPHAPGTTIDVANILGQVIATPNPGHLVFEHAGAEFTLQGLVEEGSDQLFIVFADRTSGPETYGAGRQLYVDYPSLEGTTIIDFNKAYGPPCSFTEYSSCQLPPPGNRLDVRVEAGELKYNHPDYDALTIMTSSE